MLLQVWSTVEEVAAWAMMAVVGLVVVALLLAGMRRQNLATMGTLLSAAARPDLFLGVVCFAVVCGAGQLAAAAGAAPWLAAGLCVLAGGLMLPLLLRAHAMLAEPPPRARGDLDE